MRILIIAHLYGLNANQSASRRVLMLARGMKKAGHELEVVIPVKRSDVDKDSEFVVHSFYNGQKRLTYFGRFRSRWRTYRWLSKKLADREYDGIYLYGTGIDGILYASSAKKRGICVISDNSDIRFYRGYKNKNLLGTVRAISWGIADYAAAKLSDIIVNISSFLYRRSRRINPKAQSVIVPPLLNRDIHFNEESASSIRRKYVHDNAILLGYFGSFWRYNGVGNLLRAVHGLVEAGYPVQLLLAGRITTSYGDYDNPHEIIDELGLQDSVTYIGYLENQDLFDTMGACDILMAPRIKHILTEAGAPTKLVEYLQLGKASIISATGDIGDYVVDSRDALLVQPGDVVELKSAIQRLIEEPELRKQLSLNAKDAANKFDIGTAISPLLVALENYDCISSVYK